MDLAGDGTPDTAYCRAAFGDSSSETCRNFWVSLPADYLKVIYENKYPISVHRHRLEAYATASFHFNLWVSL